MTSPGNDGWIRTTWPEGFLDPASGWELRDIPGSSSGWVRAEWPEDFDPALPFELRPLTPADVPTQRITHSDYSETRASKENPVSKLADGSFWADTLSRAGRQALQAAIPTLLIVAGGSVNGLNVADALTAVGVAAAVTVLKALAGWTSSSGASLKTQAFERAVSAAAGTGLGMLAVTTWSDVVATDWAAVGIAALGAAALSVTQLFVDPPKASSFALAA